MKEHPNDKNNKKVESLNESNVENNNKLSPEELNILDMLKTRKTSDMILIEYNLMLKTLGKELKSKEWIQNILLNLKKKNLVVSITGTNGNEYWVDKDYF